MVQVLGNFELLNTDTVPAQSPEIPRTQCRDTKVLLQTEVEGATFFNQYMGISYLARGAYGKVYLCFNTEDHCLYAVKCVRKTMTTVVKQPLYAESVEMNDSVSGGHRCAKKMAPATPVNPMIALQQEIDIMRLLQHPNIVALHEVIDDPASSRMLLVLQYMAGGCMVSRRDMDTSAVPRMQPALARLHFTGICHGLKHMHDQGIVHGDIKPDNVLLGGPNGAVLSDLGCAIRCGDDMLKRPRHGTPAFMSPEMSQAHRRYKGKAADVYALGATLYTLVCGRTPFVATSVNEIFEKHRTEALAFPPGLELAPELRDLLHKMLTKEPAERATLAEVMAHPWTLNQRNDLLPAPEALTLAEVLTQTPEGGSPLTEESFADGEALVREGRAGSSAFLILEGQVEVCVHVPLRLPRSTQNLSSSKPGNTACGQTPAPPPTTSPAQQSGNAAEYAQGIADSTAGGCEKPNGGDHEARGYPLGQGIGHGNHPPIEPLMGRIAAGCAMARSALEWRSAASREREYSLALRGVGDLVGEMAPLQPVKPSRRCATVRARGMVTALVVPEACLHAVLPASPEAWVQLKSTAWARRSEKTVLQALIQLADMRCL